MLHLNCSFVKKFLKPKEALNNPRTQGPLESGNTELFCSRLSILKNLLLRHESGLDLVQGGRSTVVLLIIIIYLK